MNPMKFGGCLSESKLILEQIGVPNILDYQPQIDEDELNCFF